MANMKENAWNWKMAITSLQRMLASAREAREVAENGTDSEHFTAVQWYNGNKNDFFKEMEHLQETLEYLKDDAEEEGK